MCHLVVITEELSAFRNPACSCRFGEAISLSLSVKRTHVTHNLAHKHTCVHLCFGLCFELIPATGEAHRKLADNNIILWSSYGNMPLLLWRNMDIMAFRGSLGNYMAVMLLRFNGIFRFSIYPTSLGGKSIKLFTFAAICPGLSRVHNSGKVAKVKCKTCPHTLASEGGSSEGPNGWRVPKEWIEEDGFCKTRSAGMVELYSGIKQKHDGQLSRSRKSSQLLANCFSTLLDGVSIHLNQQCGDSVWFRSCYLGTGPSDKKFITDILQNVA